MSSGGFLEHPNMDVTSWHAMGLVYFLKNPLFRFAWLWVIGKKKTYSPNGVANW